VSPIVAPSPPADDAFAESLRGFGPLGILAIIVILLASNDYYLPLGAILVLLWAWRSHTPWHDLGFVRPGSWILTAVAGVSLGIAFKLFMKALVMPLPFDLTALAIIYLNLEPAVAHIIFK
jgi:hypothetical protein